MKDLYLEFSGWTKVSPETKMVCISDNEELEGIITVAQWQALTKETQEFYVLEDILAALRDGDGVEYTEINLVEENDDIVELDTAAFFPLKDPRPY